ncbi:hypothetical protein AMJ49_06680 [Parcubacteria bacterium DG_74_2]|nr:MAG: hypothetical protein AMJ49_06680 [Parcubacteria bacterium DG_74_2]
MSKETQNTENILRKDSEWSVIDGEPCQVISFTPIATIKNGKVLITNKTEPYASVILECKKLSGEIKGFICHKMDFGHLWAAFKDRGIKDNEEVIIFYSKKHFKSYAKIFSAFMPRLWVMICHKGAFELMTDPNSKPELQGEARFLAKKPIIDWKPKVME